MQISAEWICSKQCCRVVLFSQWNASCQSTLQEHHERMLIELKPARLAIDQHAESRTFPGKVFEHSQGVTEWCAPAARQETSWEAAGEPLQALLAGAVRSVEFTGGQVVVDAPRRGRVYLPGSFNPLHDGHRCGAAP